MSERDFAVTDDALLAYADDRLGEPERSAVERYLAAHPEKAAEMAHWQRQNEALTALFAPVANEPVPARLKPHRIAHAIAQSRRDWYRSAAAAVIVLLAGASIGWFGRDYLTPTEAASDRLIQSAVTAHALYVKESLHAVEVAADVPHLMTWLSNRIDTQVNAPNLTDQGFTFIGGRLLPPEYDEEDTTSPAAQLMYEDAANNRVTVYLTGKLKDPTVDFVKTDEKGVEAFYWADNRITCTVVGSLPPDEMKLVARKVYEQLTWRPDPGSRG